MDSYSRNGMVTLIAGSDLFVNAQEEPLGFHKKLSNKLIIEENREKEIRKVKCE